jgi:hypothetical protein
MFGLLPNIYGYDSRLYRYGIKNERMYRAATLMHSRNYSFKL